MEVKRPMDTFAGIQFHLMMKVALRWSSGVGDRDNWMIWTWGLEIDLVMDCMWPGRKNMLGMTPRFLA